MLAELTSRARVCRLDVAFLVVDVVQALLLDGLHGSVECHVLDMLREEGQAQAQVVDLDEIVHDLIHRLGDAGFVHELVLLIDFVHEDDHLC